VILDRDGTLIDVVRDAETGTVTTAFHPSHVRFLDGVIDGLRALTADGWLLALATNQPGPAKGHFPREAVLRTNAAIVAELAARGVPVAAVHACMHHPSGGPGGDPSLIGPCTCRKPAPGMLDAIALELDLDRASSWMVGDSASSDVEAGRAAGLRTALLLPKDRCELCPLRGAAAPKNAPDLLISSISDFAKKVRVG